MGDASTWYQRARDVGAAHGFFSLESTACGGLGISAMQEGRHEEGVALLRNALAAAELNEMDDPMYQLHALEPLIQSLFTIDSLDEAEAMVLRYRCMAKEQSEKEGLVFAEIDSLFWSARICEVIRPPARLHRGCLSCCSARTD